MGGSKNQGPIDPYILLFWGLPKGATSPIFHGKHHIFTQPAWKATCNALPMKHITGALSGHCGHFKPKPLEAAATLSRSHVQPNCGHTSTGGLGPHDSIGSYDYGFFFGHLRLPEPARNRDWEAPNLRTSNSQAPSPIGQEYAGIQSR